MECIPKAGYDLGEEALRMEEEFVKKPESSEVADPQEAGDPEPADDEALKRKLAAWLGLTLVALLFVAATGSSR